MLVKYSRKTLLENKWTNFDYKLGCNVRLQRHSISFLLNVNFDKWQSLIIKLIVA